MRGDIEELGGQQKRVHDMKPSKIQKRSIKKGFLISLSIKVSLTFPSLAPFGSFHLLTREKQHSLREESQFCNHLGQFLSKQNIFALLCICVRNCPKLKHSTQPRLSSKGATDPPLQFQGRSSSASLQLLDQSSAQVGYNVYPSKLQ